MKSQKNIKISPTAKKDTFQASRELSDSELQSLRQDFYQSLLQLEAEDEISLEKLNFGEELPPD